MLGRVVLCIFVLQLVSAQVQLQPNPFNGIRGQNLTITCTFPSTTVTIELRLGNADITTLPKFLGSRLIGSTAAEYIYGPLEDSDDGSMFTCDDFNGNTDSETLDVLYAPESSVQPNVVESSLTGTAVFNYTVDACESSPPAPSQPVVSKDDAPELSVLPNVVESSLTGSAVFNYTVDANPPTPSLPVVFRDGSQVVNRITISDTSVTFSDIRCRDNGTYTLQSSNAVGSGNVTFSLLVTRSAPIWLVNRIFANTKRIENLSEVIIACPEELLSVSCVFSNYSVSGVQFTTRFDATAMTLELLLPVVGSTFTVTANAICTASNQEGATSSGMFTVERILQQPDNPA